MDASTVASLAAVLTIALSVYNAIANRPKVSADTSEVQARARKIDAETDNIIIGQLREEMRELREDKRRCEAEIELLGSAVKELRARIRALENPPSPFVSYTDPDERRD